MLGLFTNYYYRDVPVEYPSDGGVQNDLTDAEKPRWQKPLAEHPEVAPMLLLGDSASLNQKAAFKREVVPQAMVPLSGGAASIDLRPERGADHGWRQVHTTAFVHRDELNKLFKGVAQMNGVPGFQLDPQAHQHEDRAVYQSTGCDPRLSRTMTLILAKALTELNLQNRFIIPKQFECEIPGQNGGASPGTCIVSTNYEQQGLIVPTWKEIGNDRKWEETVKEVCQWIMVTGLANTSVASKPFANLVPQPSQPASGTPNRKIAVVDPDPMGLLRVAGQPADDKGEGCQRVSRYALVGLLQFKQSIQQGFIAEMRIVSSTPAASAVPSTSAAARVERKDPVKEESQEMIDAAIRIVDEAIADLKKGTLELSELQRRVHNMEQEISWFMLVISFLSLGLIPLILLISAAINSGSAHSTFLPEPREPVRN
jgi:hypothetical protein